ncbi:rhodanese-like domain-containing protein [Pelagicoccus mobilis]|uniref:Rhodanese-like domain-containing protein n=1 Tax=Pelagicoccus mobilis TaxID=415221 RepID=A0A934VKW9_9BACT|nr:rhodanese-like domain-containing protein [Pelagicoccus mobilis]MBK1877131.1 rhodanese-like domain-containing protein [Pelagicoccus mobilis]
MKADLKLVAILTLSLLPCFLYAEVEQALPVRFAELIKEENTVLVDVRSPEEAKAAHIKGSKLVNYYANTFREEIQKLPKTKKILLYCRSGNRSGKTASYLESLGFEQLVNQSGGINAWKREGLPVVEM